MTKQEWLALCGFLGFSGILATLGMFANYVSRLRREAEDAERNQLS